MKKISEPIVFFGSGPVAAASLRLLADSFVIEAVITKPRPAHHKGDVPVLRVADELSLPTYTAGTRAELDELCTMRSFTSRVGVLIDFGIIVSRKVIDSFPLGIVNSHFSILPEWRGADPITFAVLSGQQQTGVSLMLLVEAMDEGPLLAYGTYDLPTNITTPQLTSALIELSNKLLVDVLPKYMHDEIKGQSQHVTNRDISYSRKLSKSDSILDFSKPALQLEREIRAFSGWPTSRTTLGDTDVIVTKAHVVDANGKPGTVGIIDKLPIIYCSEQALALDMVKPAGRSEMSGQAFVAGHRHLFQAS